MTTTHELRIFCDVAGDFYDHFDDVAYLIEMRDRWIDFLPHLAPMLEEMYRRYDEPEFQGVVAVDLMRLQQTLRRIASDPEEEGVLLDQMDVLAADLRSEHNNK